jgi:hypothetical protein
MQSRFVQRLHRASDDFEATELLRVVETALSLTPEPESTWQRRERQPRRRWWRRRTAR